MADSDIPSAEDTGLKYRKRYEMYTEMVSELRRRARIIGHLRLISFLLFSAGIITGLWEFSHPKFLWLSVAGVALIVFVFLVIWHSTLYRRLHKTRVMAELNSEADARWRRDWSQVPCPTVPVEYEVSSTARDLDIFGHAALIQLVGPIHLPESRALLARWFLHAASIDDIGDRQRAIAELAPQLDHRQEFAALSREVGTIEADPEEFLEWAEGETWLDARPALFPWVWALLGMELLLLALHASGVTHYPFWILMIPGNLIFTRFHMKPIHAVFSRAGSRRRVFSTYAGLFGHIKANACTSSLIARLKEKSHGTDCDAASALMRLDGLIHLSEVRLSGMLYGFLQGFFLWDFHVLKRLERWQKRHGTSVRKWVDVLGEYEALASLSSLAYDHPGWIFPDIRADRAEIAAARLGHPLLKPGVCVKNDVTVGPPGSFFLVTGSNMSGKSTLLRAIGVNVVLALAGGPVCAGSMTLCPVVLGTSFRIRDSLTEGISYYMAELLRLKEIITLAKNEDGPVLLYIFDEILMGTNIVERQSAVRKVIKYLVDAGAIGVLATHDLTIADARELRAACRPVHFTEQFVEGEDGEDMVFDYVLRHGVARSSNALKMLKMVNLVDTR